MFPVKKLLTAGKIRITAIFPDKGRRMGVPGQSGNKKHRFLSVPEAFLHKCKCLFQLPGDLFRTGLSLFRHFRKKLPDPFKASLCFCDMLLADGKAEFLQSADHKLFRGLLICGKKLRLQTDSQTFLLL